MYNNELYHYGVKGMKWGHRKRVYRDAKLAARQRRDAAIASANDRSDARTNKNFSSNPGASKNGFVRGKDNRAAYRQAEAANIKQLKTDRAKAHMQYKADLKKAKSQYKSQIKSDKQKIKSAKPNKDKQVRNAVGKAMTMSMGAAKTVAAAQEGANAVRNMTRNNGKGAGQNIMNMAWYAAGARREKRMYDWYNNN